MYTTEVPQNLQACIMFMTISTALCAHSRTHQSTLCLFQNTSIRPLLFPLLINLPCLSSRRHQSTLCLFQNTSTQLMLVLEHNNSTCVCSKTQQSNLCLLQNTKIYLVLISDMSIHLMLTSGQITSYLLCPRTHNFIF